MAEDWGPRIRTRFAITARGLVQLYRWVGPPFGPELAGPAYDPLRTAAGKAPGAPRPQAIPAE